MTARVQSTEVLRITGGQARRVPDLLVAEEPLEIRLGFGPRQQRQQRSISITMRTPGHDLELAAGFLYGEGILNHPGQLRDLAPCPNVERPEEVGNVVKAELEPGVAVDLDRLERHFYTTSSCGVCGKASLEAVSMQACPVLPVGQPQVAPAVLQRLPDIARAAQTVFKHTGGIHAASLHGPQGDLIALYEDVGRHNALDKLIGAQFISGKLPLSDTLALASGRLSFELVQKALRAGIPVLAAVGAPSSLAVDLAQEFGMTLCGFLRGDRVNIYTGAERIQLAV